MSSADIFAQSGASGSGGGASTSASTLARPSTSAPPMPTKRASVACTRCRRYRTKCFASPPYTSSCENCIKAGVDKDCHFPARGESAADRAYRSRLSSKSASKREADDEQSRPSNSPSQGPPSAPVSRGDILPPLEDMTEALNVFQYNYFQITFLPQALFLERLEHEPDSINLFLLLAILTLSARWTPSLIKRHGSPTTASNIYSRAAQSLITSEMMRPTLEACQGFFLLSLYEWGNGAGDQSAMLMGIAVRMAVLLRLHQEQTYDVSSTATPEEITQSEVARRTFWAIATHEDLASGTNRPPAFHLADIDVLLPCTEEEFNFAVPPSQRTSLQGTIPALADPETTRLPSRSFFATIVQSHALWAKVSRWACRKSTSGLPPWMPSSEYAMLDAELRQFYTDLPAKHKWSVQNLRGMRAQNTDIPFLSMTTCYKLSVIFLRRSYLPAMASAVDPDGSSDEGELLPPDQGYWQAMATEMIQGSIELIISVEEFFKLRAPRLGFPPILIFSIYSAGNMCLWLLRWPTMCPPQASNASYYLHRCIDLLGQLKEVWPMAEAWLDALRASFFSSPPAEQGVFKASARAERSMDESVGIFRPASEVPSPSSAGPSPTSAQSLTRPTTFTPPSTDLVSQPQTVFNMHQQIQQPVFPSFTNPSTSQNATEYNPLMPSLGTIESYDFGSLTADLEAFYQGELPHFFEAEGISRGSWSWEN